MDPKFSLIIPIYNEVDAIFPLIIEIEKEFSKEKPEIIIIDDGSTDSFNIQFKKIVKNRNIKVFRHTKNLGKCMAMLTGVKKAKKNLIAVMDGDGQNPPSEVKKLIIEWHKTSEYSNRPLLICGHRINRKDTLMKRVSSKIANKLRKKLLMDDCYDTACALKVFEKSEYLKLPYFRNMHRYIPALFKMIDGKIINYPVIDRPRLVGKSKFNFNNRFWVGIIDLIKVKLLIKRRKI